MVVRDLALSAMRERCPLALWPRTLRWRRRRRRRRAEGIIAKTGVKSAGGEGILRGRRRRVESRREVRREATTTRGGRRCGHGGEEILAAAAIAAAAAPRAARISCHFYSFTGNMTFRCSLITGHLNKFFKLYESVFASLPILLKLLDEPQLFYQNQVLLPP